MACINVNPTKSNETSRKTTIENSSAKWTFKLRCEVVLQTKTKKVKEAQNYEHD